MASPHSPWRLHIESKSDSSSCTSVSAIALISDFLDLAHLSIQEGAALATNWIKDRPKGLKLQNLALATMTVPVLSSLPRNLTADVQYAINNCESSGPGQQLILHGNPSAPAKDFSPMAVLRRHFLPNVHFQCCMSLQGTLGAHFDIFAASDEFTSWVLLWKTRSRPIGVRVCHVAQFNFFSTAFDPREWTMVVFWKDDSGCQPQLITPENGGGGYDTSSPSPPRLTFFDDPDVPLGPSSPPGPPHPPGHPPGWPPAPPPAGGERERVRAESASRE